jgi:hypothetical protein
MCSVEKVEASAGWAEWESLGDPMNGDLSGRLVDLASRPFGPIPLKSLIRRLFHAAAWITPEKRALHSQSSEVSAAPDAMPTSRE